MGDLGNALSKIRDDSSTVQGKCKQYKEKLRLANSTIKTLSGKVVQYELDRNARPNSENIRVGGFNLENAAGRDSNQSNRGSDVDIKEAIQKVMQDEQLQS